MDIFVFFGFRDPYIILIIELSFNLQTTRYQMKRNLFLP